MQRKCEFEVPVEERDVLSFAQLSSDWNPLHIDAAYASKTEFGRPVAHGALLVAFVSRVLGMYIPGQRSLILSMKIRFPKPLFYPARVQVTGELKGFNQSTGQVSVRIIDPAKAWCVLDAEVLFALHADSAPEPVTEARRNGCARPDSERKRLLVTGGTGGIGSRIVPVLAAEYDITCLTRKAAEPSRPEIQYERVDVEQAGDLEGFLERTPSSDFYGVVHLSSPPVSQGFVSDDLAALQSHLRHGVEAPILLARWARRPPSGVKRMVLFGSTAGLKYPKPTMGAYSLAKGALEHLSRLLMADLSGQRATVNVVTPTAVPVGMNEGMPERARKALAGRIPTGRLVDASDIAQVVLFLLSEGASQINGATIGIDGGLAG